jgi:hypothetical protein
VLYLHEIIDIIGDGQQAYLESVGERARHSEAAGISRLVGTWRVIGSTHRWPRVVNLWEMDGWEHWAASLERQFLPERKDPHLSPWWSAATKWRSGGFDRILEPAPCSPSRDSLRARGLTAWVCEQTLVSLTPGTCERFLDAVGERLCPLMEARGLTLMGAYTVPMRPDEAMLLWAAPTFRALCAAYAQRRADELWQDWERFSAGLRRESETMWLVPSTECFFHPSRRGE